MSTRSVTVEQLQKEYEQKWSLIQSEMKALKQRLVKYEKALEDIATAESDLWLTAVKYIAKEALKE